MYVSIKEPYGKIRDALLKLQKLQELIALTNDAREELAKVEGAAVNELADKTNGGILAEVYLVRIDGKWYAVETDIDDGELIAIEEVIETTTA